jgi:hypothetical protein
MSYEQRFFKSWGETESAEARGDQPRGSARSPRRTTDSPDSRMRDNTPRGSQTRVRTDRLAAVPTEGLGLVPTKTLGSSLKEGRSCRRTSRRSDTGKKGIESVKENLGGLDATRKTFEKIGAARLNEAASAYEGALVVFRDAKADYLVAIAERNLNRVQREISQLKESKSVLGEKAK